MGDVEAKLERPDIGGGGIDACLSKFSLSLFNAHIKKKNHLLKNHLFYLLIIIYYLTMKRPIPKDSILAIMSLGMTSSMTRLQREKL